MKYVYRNAIQYLSQILKQENVHNILMFTGQKSYQFIRSAIEHILGQRNIIQYNDFAVNPKEEDLFQAIVKLKFATKQIDIVLAIGGGSVIDFAKAYRVYTYCNKKLVAIPTTFGSGSEVTQFAVLYVNGIKTSLDAPAIKPEYALVDSSFALSQSRYLKACTGLDAFCHAIESFWNVHSTEASRDLAWQAMTIIQNNLVQYVNSKDLHTADNMAQGANLAGEAINITRTTAAHAFSYAFTQKYGIPHGHAVALTIAQVMKYNQQCIKNGLNILDPRGINFVQNIMQQLEDIFSKDSIAYFAKLFQQIGIETDFQTLGIDDVNALLSQVNVQRLQNNPVLVDASKLFT